MTATARQREAWADRSPRRKADLHRVDVRLDRDAIRRINIEPCHHCGVRSDVGCKHVAKW